MFLVKVLAVLQRSSTVMPQLKHHLWRKQQPQQQR
jgi:hypothetical protein